MAAVPSAWEGYPDYNDIMQVVDAWRKQTALGGSICLLLARDRRVGEGFVIRSDLTWSGPTLVTGSVKMGQPIEHPIWQITSSKQRVLTTTTNPRIVRTTWSGPVCPWGMPFIVLFTPLYPLQPHFISPPMYMAKVPLVAGAPTNCDGRY